MLYAGKSSLKYLHDVRQKGFYEQGGGKGGQTRGLRACAAIALIV